MLRCIKTLPRWPPCRPHCLPITGAHPSPTVPPAACASEANTLPSLGVLRPRHAAPPLLCRLVASRPGRPGLERVANPSCSGMLRHTGATQHNHTTPVASPPLAPPPRQPSGPLPVRPLGRRIRSATRSPPNRTHAWVSARCPRCGVMGGAPAEAPAAPAPRLQSRKSPTNSRTRPPVAARCRAACASEQWSPRASASVHARAPARQGRHHPRTCGGRSPARPEASAFEMLVARWTACVAAAERGSVSQTSAAAALPCQGCPRLRCGAPLDCRSIHAYMAACHC